MKEGQRQNEFCAHIVNMTIFQQTKLNADNVYGCGYPVRWQLQEAQESFVWWHKKHFE